MAVTFSPAGSTQNATSQTSVAVTTTQALNPGDYLVVLMAYNNSGGGGADPMSGTLALAPVAGAFGAGVGGQTGLNDPGTASSGLAARCIAFPVTVPIPSSTSITVSWSGAAVAKAVVFMKVSSDQVLAYRTNSGATGTNGVAVTTVALTTPSVTNAEGVLCWAAHENGAAITGDADTTSGTWSAVYGTFNGSAQTGMAAYFQSKVVTATATQAFNPTGTSSDWIVGCLIFKETPIPTITQAAYRIYDDGTETGAVALAAQDTAANGDVIFGDGIGQLRVRLQSTNAGIINATDNWQLQWEKNGNGVWDHVPSPSGLVPIATVFGAPATVAMPTAASLVVGQSFLGNGQPLKGASFYASKIGTPPGNVTAVLYAHTGTFGTVTGVGTGSPLAVSTPRAGTTMQTSYRWEDFVFDGSFTLVNGTPYVMGFTTDTTTTVANVVAVTTTVPTDSPGTGTLLSGGSWFSSTNDFLCRVYTPGTPPVTPYASPNTTDAGVTTNRLGAGTGSFSAGEISETGLVTDLGWSSNNYTELLFPVAIVKAGVVAGDVIRFRVLRNGSTTGMTYTAVPTVNVVESTITQASYRIYDDGTETGAVALAAQDTPANGDITSGDGIGQLRVRLQSTSVAPPVATDDWQLQWEKNTSGSWYNVAASVPEQSLDSQLTDTSFGIIYDESAEGEAIAQSFIGSDATLTKVDFKMSKGGAPPGDIVAYLYSHNGTFGDAGSSPGAVLATSNPVAASSLAVTPATAIQSFVFPSNPVLAAGTPYFVGLAYAVAGSNDSNRIFVRYVTSGGAVHPGQGAKMLSSGTWSNPGYDLYFQVYGNPVVSAKPYASPNTTDGAVTTNRLGAGSGSFVAGKISETGLVTDLGWSANNFTELLFPLTIVKASVVAGDVIRFRVLRNGVTTGMTYTAVPTVNVIQGATNVAATITTDWGSWTGTATGTVSAGATNWSATISTVWGVWTASAAATPDHVATSTQSWGTWTASATGIRQAYATITTTWGAWTASASGSISGSSWGIPQNVNATTTGPTTVTVTWDAVVAATGYDIERNAVVIATNHPASPYNDSGLSSNTPYTYRVRAVG